MKTLTNTESIIISWTRVLSMIAIFICHICETYCNHWAYVFNIGVQTFFVLSGFLYGCKYISDYKKWMVARVIRVYIPMLTLLILMLPVYIIFKPSLFSMKLYISNILNLQGVLFAMGGGMLLGLRHLWFVTAIFFDYIITPFLQKMRNHADIYILSGIFSLLFSYYCLPGPIVFMLSWIVLYSIGYLFVSSKYQKQWIITIISIVLMTILICLLTGWSSVTHYFNPIGRCLHDFGGLCLVLLPLFLLRDKKINLPTIVKILDKYSFQIYLIHYIIIIGPFSLAFFFEKIQYNILVILLSTTLGTFVFCIINQFVTSIIKKRIDI